MLRRRVVGFQSRLNTASDASSLCWRIDLCDPSGLHDAQFPSGAALKAKNRGHFFARCAKYNAINSAV
jgi:hypothetical protein